MKELTTELHEEIIKIADEKYDPTSPKSMDKLLKLPYWQLKPYVRPPKPPTLEKAPKRKGTSTLEQNKRRKEQKAERVKKYHQKALVSFISYATNVKQQKKL